MAPQRISHDKPYFEPERPDELSTGKRDERDVLQASAGAQDRDAAGRLVPGARALPSMGGQAKRGSTKLSHTIDSETLEPQYRRRARALRLALVNELARTVGGGVCGILPSLFVRHASIATALSEQLLDAGDVDRAVRFAEASRMHLLYAREIAAKDAASSPRNSTSDIVARITAAAAAKKAEAK
jgi:hypothetical protein